MASPSTPPAAHPDIEALALASLCEGPDGTFVVRTDPTRAAVREALEAIRDGAALAAAVQKLLDLAFVLDTKLRSPEAAAWLLEVAASASAALQQHVGQRATVKVDAARAFFGGDRTGRQPQPSAPPANAVRNAPGAQHSLSSWDDGARSGTSKTSKT